MAPPLPRTSSHRSTGSVASTPRAGTTSDQTTPRRRARNLLRDYYGLNAPTPSKEGDHLAVDSSAFDPRALYTHLLNSQTLPDLIKKENDLLVDIRELDAERQSLVYNHHHELIEASTLIQKMKTRAESLDSSLEQLGTAFEAIAQLTDSLSTAFPPAVVTGPSMRALDPIKHLQPIVDLPDRLRATNARAGLWGEWEPILREWQISGVQGVDEILEECRQIIKTRRQSVSAATT
ncbi:uncharacterized protein L969DRAFT_97216 [Mixia osmundae IAM 14324]|uniref:Vacuolar protein sorting-associated protein 51 homolog n=1 Tax=Mixia osmundae (strain CBS 9802 / IAM 14324 / JCM 22182 / KY 12970) TaxID=764103 RepID=G7DW15_MIXOS|nr:uncharacterized protein L969DRAFT_97216 [Mixia osmundae IAM 14324]KEI36479.1 hypothetical protein L969DRAFT_97216 [Mixia osmundae IAM 14324]GAA94821.1 hypothetical protein E5Q_01475 [Mixia osmundae IAM 14324]